MTDPAQAAGFVAQTGVDALAVCIGNVHGRYPGEPRLGFARLKRSAPLCRSRWYCTVRPACPTP